MVTQPPLWAGCPLLAPLAFPLLTFLGAGHSHDLPAGVDISQLGPVVSQDLSCCLLHTGMLVFLHQLESWNNTGRCISDCESPGQTGPNFPGSLSRASLGTAAKPSLASLLAEGGKAALGTAAFAHSHCKPSAFRTYPAREILPGDQRSLQ